MAREWTTAAPASASEPPARWAGTFGIRVGVSFSAGVAILLLLAPFVRLTTRFIIAWNASVIVLLTLTAIMMWRSSPRETMRRSQREEPSNVVILSATLVAALASLGGIVYAQEQMGGMSHAQILLHQGHSILGVLLAWLLIHTVYSLHYAKMYYDETRSPDEGPFMKGLAFPGEGDIVDYWDFVYYSFTIAMCYQTSDVTITSPMMRRLTIFHATVSFMFVMLILGVLINIIGNVI